LVPSVVVLEESKLSEDFVRVTESKDVQSSTMKAYDLAGEKVCIVNVEGNYYAIGNVCTHLGGPLDQGTHEFVYLSRICLSIESNLNASNNKYYLFLVN
jgi:hypothetical protein